jgi:transposase
MFKENNPTTAESGFSLPGEKIEKLNRIMEDKIRLLQEKEDQYKRLRSEPHNIGEQLINPDAVSDEEATVALINDEKLAALEREIAELRQELELLGQKTQSALDEHGVYTDVLLKMDPDIGKN